MAAALSSSSGSSAHAEEPISYIQRKTQQRSSRDGSWIQNQGIDYSTTEQLVSELFDDEHFPQKIRTFQDEEPVDVIRSYIYIISKVVDGRTFIKIGMSNFGNTRQKLATRLESAQTFLIPGLENGGFKLHNIFFYRREAKHVASTPFAQLVEQGLHKKLKYKFERAVIYMPSGTKSEWYLPDKDKYREFFDMAFVYINSQIPQPEEAYLFYVDKAKDQLVRQHKDQFMPKITREDIIEHRGEQLEQKKHERARAVLLGKDKALKRGSKQYFKDKLILSQKGTGTGTGTSAPPPPLGQELRIVDIYYHNKQSTNVMKFREYYAQVEAVSGEKPSELPSGKGIILTFSTENAKKEKRYYTHIRNVLEYMKHVSKTMEHETYKMLAHNYNHYYSEPIKQAKALLERNIGERRRFKMSKQEWLIGRFLRDNKDDLYRVTGLSRDPADSVYVKNVLCRKIQGGSADYEYVVGSKDIKVDPHVAIQLVVDYYDDVKYETLDYSIDHVVQDDGSGQQESLSNQEHSVLDFVLINRNYFSQGGKKLPDQFVGVITQKKWNFTENKDTGKKVSEYQYDILFENGETWEFGMEEVHKNSKLLKDKSKIQKFIKETKKNKNVIRRLCEKYRISCGNTQAANAMLPSSIVAPRRSRRLNPTLNDVQVRNETSKKVTPPSRSSQRLQNMKKATKTKSQTQKKRK